VKNSSTLKRTADEPMKTSGSGQRLESEAKMRNSAEAYLRGSADVRLFLIRFRFCMTYKCKIMSVFLPSLLHQLLGAFASCMVWWHNG